MFSMFSALELKQIIEMIIQLNITEITLFHMLDIYIWSVFLDAYNYNLYVNLNDFISFKYLMFLCQMVNWPSKNPS